MADKEQDPFGFIINDCRYSCSQEELLTQVQFAREGENSADSRGSGGKSDGKTTHRHGSKSTAVDADSANLGFGGERKSEGNCEEEEEEEEERVKKGELKKHNCSGKEEEEEDEVVVVTGKKKVSFGGVIDVDEAEEEEKSEKKKRRKKRELPRSMFELVGWDEVGIVGAQRDIKAQAPKQDIGNVKASVGGKAESIPNSSNKGGNNVETSTSVTNAGVVVDDAKSEGIGNEEEDETNECILDALKLLVSVTHKSAHHGHGANVDIFHTANQCGMLFPTSRFLSHLHPHRH